MLKKPNMYYKVVKLKSKMVNNGYSQIEDV